MPFQSAWCKSVTRTVFFFVLFFPLSKSKVEEEGEEEEDNCEFQLLSGVDSDSEKVSEDVREILVCEMVMRVYSGDQKSDV